VPKDEAKPTKEVQTATGVEVWELRETRVLPHSERAVALLTQVIADGPFKIAPAEQAARCVLALREAGLLALS
jgi:hypothetical protein